MKEYRYHELCGRVDMNTQTNSSVYLQQGDDGLTEDLIMGYVTRFTSGRPFAITSVSTAKGLAGELQYLPPDGRHWCIVVRDAHKVFTAKSRESLLLMLEHNKRNARLLVVLVGDEPDSETKEWFLQNKSYGVVSEPTFEKLGAWMATKTAGRWDYRSEIGALITKETGLMLMEHVGWDYTAAIQAAKTIRAFTGEMIEWPVVSALVPPKVNHGYADALVFGKGRRGAYTLAQGIAGEQVMQVLGLVRFYLRQFAKLRAQEVERMSDRAVSEETGIHVWHWRTKYKPVYPSYTNERIRMRLAVIEEAMRAARSGVEIGVLEVVVAGW